MTKLIQILTAHRRLILLAAGTLVLAITVIWGAGVLGRAIKESRISKLEVEKQEFLKREAESRDRELILQGQIKAQNEVIQNLSNQIVDSDSRVTVAHSQTQSARANYEKVRTDPPKFNSSDDAGRVAEFSTGLRELYSDSPR